METRSTSDLSGAWHTFDALSPLDVHDLLRLRQDIFILEQSSLYGDIDGKDPAALHYLLRDRGTGLLAGAIRFFDGTEDPLRIGRIVVARSHRGHGLGRRLVLAGLEKAHQTCPQGQIHLSAQAHLENFYRALGFRTVSEVYLKDNIPHLDMMAIA